MIAKEEHLDLCAIIDFYFPNKQSYSQRVFVFTTALWTGTPQHSDEMDVGKFFNRNALPKNMWDSDRIWLKDVLAGKKFYGYCVWNDDNKTVKSFAFHALENAYERRN